MSQQMVDLMESVWRSIDGLCSSLTPDQWATPTECPGWAVQDQVSHLVGSECRILGRPAPEHEPSDTSHVRNEVGQGNEVLVDYRRQFSGAEVLAEFREITAERLTLLRAMSEEDFAAETPNPLGSGPYTDMLAIRIYDAWVHEQDMRRALGIPGHLDGPVAQHSYGRTRAAMPFVVGRKVKPDDGSTVVFRNHRRGGWHYRPEYGGRPRPTHGFCAGLSHGTPDHGTGAVQRTGNREVERRARVVKRFRVYRRRPRPG